MEELNKDQTAELESLRAWKAEIEAQEPVAFVHRCEKVSELSWFGDSSSLANRKDWIGMVPLYAAAPVVSPDVGLLKLTVEQKVDRICLLECLLNSALDENQSLKTELEAARRQQFTAAVVYSAAQIIQAHDEPTVAEDLLNTVIKPTDDLTGCAEYDLAILRKAIPAWANVKEGE